jgi:GNAT superfamily N-acetyltransferase
MPTPDPSRVHRARTTADWTAAALLLDEYRRWVAEAIGADVTATQPAARDEFTDPARFYRPPDAALVLARVGERPAGVVGVHRLTRSAAELKRMYLRPWARGRGLSRALLVEAVAAADDLGFDELLLQTHPGAMPVAHRLYREYGFRPAESFHDLGVPGVLTLGLDLAGRRAGAAP